jgi:hypothetical protein
MTRKRIPVFRLVHLYGAMHTLDGNHYRGYLVVEDRPELQ